MLKLFSVTRLKLLPADFFIRITYSYSKWHKSQAKVRFLQWNGLKQRVQNFAYFKSTNYGHHHHYRAMHFSAKRGIAIACRPSVCLSVTLVDQDHIGWKSYKLIVRTISPTPSLFVAQRPSTYFHGNMGKFWGD